MQNTDFSENAPGRMVKSPQGAWAFVPDDLPPRLEPTWELMEEVAHAVGALKQLAGVAHTLPNENLLIRPFLQREAVLSSRIEGTEASLPGLFVLEAEEPREREANFEEVANYVDALDYGLNRLQTLPVSLPLLQEMHARLMRGVRGHEKAPGKFRRQQVWIGGPTPFEARFVPPPPPEMNQSLQAFEKYLHQPSPVPFLVRLAFIHYQFETIHPFLDGNGRMGRLLLTLLLCAEGVLPRPLLYLSGYFERHRRQYYDGLLAVSQRNAWMEWTLFFLRAIQTQSLDAVRRSALLLELRENYRHRLHESGASLTAQRMVDQIFIYPAFSVQSVAKRLDIEKRTARLNVNKLCEIGILQEATGRQRNRIFVAPAVSDILDAPDAEN
jgi:Fic family protein